jgi:hypothetical protein
MLANVCNSVRMNLAAIIHPAGTEMALRFSLAKKLSRHSEGPVYLFTILVGYRIGRIVRHQFGWGNRRNKRGEVPGLEMSRFQLTY